MSSIRTTQEVFEDHLWQSNHGSVEEDFARNYADDVVLLTGEGIYRGLEGLRYLTNVLMQALPGACFDYYTRLVAGEMAFLEWGTQTEKSQVKDGADSYLIRNGRIIAQTIHYTVQPVSEN
ncbi:nuclear transport factor 2 family protein [Thermithiobacillus plumbiphilus]|uniref:Nuclear transport factor 2 family protein n=1 Tax=Thermithiobacillus plumbiphilus TaxID=1729899 RepID=A0ABU9D6P9_9PROT